MRENFIIRHYSG